MINLLKDPKNIAIAILCALTIGVGILWLTDRGSSNIERGHLKERIEILSKEKEVIEKNIIKVQKLREKDFIELTKLKSDFSKLEKNYIKVSEEEAKSKAALKQSRNELNNTRAAIKKYEENPIKRTGQNLLDSVKNKTSTK